MLNNQCMSQTGRWLEQNAVALSVFMEENTAILTKQQALIYFLLSKNLGVLLGFSDMNVS